MVIVSCSHSSSFSVADFRFKRISKLLGLPLDIVERLNTQTKRQYVKAELVDKPLTQYKHLVKKVALERTQDIDSYTDEVIHDLHCWFSLRQGGGVIEPTGEQEIAIQYIKDAVLTWSHEQKANGDCATTELGEMILADKPAANAAEGAATKQAEVAVAANQTAGKVDVEDAPYDQGHS